MSIHTLDATELLARLAARELSSVEIVRALLDRADAVDPKVRAFVHRFDEQALTEASAADAARARGEATGPLHGLPITIKESIATAGTDVTLGVPARRGNPVREDAVIVAAARAAGAIVLGKTNVPQLLLFHESDNPIWGATNNPWNLACAPGGSSGGEAAAIAAGMSPCGIGTDIGGSIRVPCAFTGVSGLKPTSDRWSNVGCVTALMGQEVVRGQNGPMARTSRDVALLFSALIGQGQSARDPAVPPLAVTDPSQVDLRGLRVGFYVNDGFLPAANSVARAVEEAARALEDAGATVIEHEPLAQCEILDVYFGALSSDGGSTIDRQLAGDEIAPQLRELRRIAGMAAPIRHVARWAMQLKNESRVKRLLEIVHEKSVAEYWQLAAKRTSIRNRVHSAWVDAGVDVVICPAHVTPALGHGDSGDFSLAGCYSMRYNFLNFPAGVVATSRVRASETVRPNATDRLERKAAKIEARSAGLPLGVQVVARPWHEHHVLAVMLALEERMRVRPDYPKTPVDPS